MEDEKNTKIESLQRKLDLEVEKVKDEMERKHRNKIEQIKTEMADQHDEVYNRDRDRPVVGIKYLWIDKGNI